MHVNLRSWAAFICLVAMVWFFATSDAQGDPMEFHGRPPELPTAIMGNAWYVFADGDIETGSDIKLEEFIRANDAPQKSLLFLNSPGGNLLAGIKLGRVIRKYRLHTYIGRESDRKMRYDNPPGECFSACALAFLGGEYRFQKEGSVYGVHRFYAPQKTDADLDTAQIISATIVQYIREMGVDPELFSLMSSAGATGIVRLSGPEMARLRVTNGGVPATKWSIESHSGLVYLKGERETWRGINKFMFICVPDGKIALYVIYDPEGRGEEAIHLNAHSLLLDGETIPIKQFQIGPTELVNGWINAKYVLTDQLIRRIATAKTVGVTMQANYNAPIFLGFDGMELGEGRDELPGFLNICRGQRPRK